MGRGYPRDLIGYGATPPRPHWPGDARVAVQFVINYEEGAENCVLHGDAHAETFLSDIVGARPWPARHMNMESLYEYGSRAGFWRLHRLFQEFDMPVTVFGVAMALQRNPEGVAAMLEADWEIASHAWRWVDHQFMPEAEERRHVQQAIEIHAQATGARPLGWYTGRNSPNTRRILREAGGFLYDSDSYADDLPYWHRPEEAAGRAEPDATGTGAAAGSASQPAHLIIPYTLDANDMRFATPQGFNSGEQFFAYLRDAFDCLYAEGVERPRMMSVGLHCRIAGRPGRAVAVRRFLEHVAAHDAAWVCRRIDIARHWHQHHPPDAAYA